MTETLSPADRGKKAAALAALGHVRPGMKLGLGTGSTAAFMVDALGEMVDAGLEVVCVPTSSRTKAQAEGLGIALTTLGDAVRLDLTIDGADEFDGHLNLIKGGGGALLQEKIVAAASDRMIVISDASKRVAALGAYPLPVEVVRFGWEATAEHVAHLLTSADVAGTGMARRVVDGVPFVTDEGHYILDLSLGRIGDPAALNAMMNLLPGVVETGLFCAMTDLVLVGQEDGSCVEIRG